MPRKRKQLPYKKERCLLSDVLPYEIPISYSNRYLYAFILRNRIEVKENSIFWLKSSAAVDRIVHLMFALPLNPNRLTDEKKIVGKQKLDFRCYELTGNSDPRPERFMMPFIYKIRHKENQFRELCVPHPKSQLMIIDFYDRCKEVILYYTSLSPFSIRAPSRISKFRFYKDQLHYARLAKDSSLIEETGWEYESLKSFFVYKTYSNIYKFYESYKYHRSEKKFNNMIKLDISKCFDSIYTHSIGWAILGKETQKESLNKNNDTFPDQFDKLMQRMNFGETNGIIIGPEFSRIFAEIILQAIDRELMHKLENGKKNLKNKIDYEIFRYVDDYFVFYNEEPDRNEIVDELQHTLKKYKLYLNTEKAIVYEKPIITEITMAKRQIASLLDNTIRFSREKFSHKDSEEEFWKGSIYINSNNLITSFKTIIKNCGVAYKDMLNYTLSIIERKCERVLEDFEMVTPEFQNDRNLMQAIISILEFVFFIYSVSPRVNTTIRLCRILRVINSFLRSKKEIDEQIQLVHKQIYDNISFILKKNKSEEQTQVETLYLLIVLSELGRNYWLEQSVLAEYLGVSLHGKNNTKQNMKALNYFSITVALFYMRNKVRYNDLRHQIVNGALEKIRQRSMTCTKDAELIFLLFDLVSCPYIEDSIKLEALDIFSVSNVSLASDIIQYVGTQEKPQMWFTNWLNFDFGTELDLKMGHEVY